MPTLNPTLPQFDAPTKHPAKYSDALYPIFAAWLPRGARVLDPMAGTGKLGNVKRYGFVGEIVCNDIEQWGTNRYVTAFHHTDAARMTWATDESFDVVCFSPPYGNRMADTYRPSDDRYVRNTYRAGLGKELHSESTAALQWGDAYRRKQTEIYRECVRVLKPRGLLLCNVSDHIRAGKRVYVSKWTLDTLRALGLQLLKTYAVKTPRLRNGANHEKRAACEYIFVFQKP